MVPALYLFLGGMRVFDAMLGDVPVESEPGNEQLDDAFPHRIAGEQPPWSEERHVLHQSWLPVPQARCHLEVEQREVAEDRRYAAQVEDRGREQGLNERRMRAGVADGQSPEDGVEYERGRRADRHESVSDERLDPHLPPGADRVPRLDRASLGVSLAPSCPLPGGLRQAARGLLQGPGVGNHRDLVAEPGQPAGYVGVLRDTPRVPGRDHLRRDVAGYPPFDQLVGSDRDLTQN